LSKIQPQKSGNQKKLISKIFKKSVFLQSKIGILRHQKEKEVKKSKNNQEKGCKVVDSVYNVA
jgi:hypothetical protein